MFVSISLHEHAVAPTQDGVCSVGSVVIKLL